MAQDLENKEQPIAAEGQATGQEAVTEPATPTKKSAYMDGFRKRHPEWKDDDEEGFYGALAADDEETQGRLKGYQDREDKLAETISSSPMNAALFMRASEGTPIPLAVLQAYPEEMRAWIDDPANEEAVKKAFEDHANKIEENRKLKAEADANLEETNKMIDQMIADGEIKDDDEVNELLAELGKIATGLMMNHVEKDWLIAAKKAINHDADVEAAKTQGQIEGRNQKITAQRKESAAPAGNHAGLGSSNAGQQLSRRDTAAATGRGGKRDMWAGMKVNKYE